VRLIGVVLSLVGLVVVVVGTFSGCGSLFSWNGRHAVLAHALSEGHTTHELVPVEGRRYTIGIQVVFDREGLQSRDGIAVVEAKMPLVVRVKDASGTTRAETAGWLDPNEPPNVLYGQAARESMRGPMPELAVERLVGPFTAASDAPLAVDVDLGPDRIGTAHVVERRLVIHDDAWPPSIRNAFIAAGVGATAFVFGIALVVVGWFKRRRTPRKRGGISASDVV
jgi:hypothetical protein